MSLKFKKIENGQIFTRDFNPLVKNNEITFPDSEQIVVIYGPNGTGKTSLIKVLGDATNTKVEFSLDNIEYQNGSDVFHIINDQNNRNIISGETKEFFLGDNIRHEYELQEQVITDRNSILSSIITLLKTSFGISAGNNPLISLIEDERLSSFIKDCVNSKSKGNKYTTEELVSLFRTLEIQDIRDFSQEKLSYLQSDFSNKESICRHLDSIEGEEVSPNTHVTEIEENTEAINILSRFHKNKCIVCDTDDINWEALLAEKTANRQSTLDALDSKVKKIIEQVIPLVPTNDPFEIKSSLISAIASGDSNTVTTLRNEINQYKNIYYKRIVNEILSVISESPLISHFTEYQQILSERPDITDEDYLYIKEIIANSMNKPLTIDRDDNNRLRISLSNQEFLGIEREHLPLSTGEQNFLSLTFEFLKAKNSDCPIVVIDDPVSSFDSIYKNKIAYAIVKILHHKKRIVLTHNTDLIRLLDSQYNHCFKLYLLNNTDGEENGFIPLKNNEQGMLISLEKLLSAFRSNVPKHVQNSELFLISMIPFMRGYANIINNKPLFDDLTQVMHGYKTEQVDIGNAYQILFGSHEAYLPASYTVSVSDILSKTVDGVHLLDNEKYPLLNKTLKHSFVYLFLRLMVEKSLVNKFNIDTNVNDQLGKIISAAFPDENDIDQIRKRIRLTSKKTLINEFNHFEGNLSIFQPAIDITDQALGKERTDLNSFVSTL